MRRILSTILFLAKLFSDKRGIRILMYHSVSNKRPYNRLSVKVDEFAKQMAYLKNQNWNVISLDAAVRRLKNRELLTSKTAVITFDDGCQDNFINAYPVLKKYAFPAIVFLTTNNIGKKGFLTWGQVEKMCQDNIDFGAHTLSHPELTKINLVDAKVEIQGSRTNIEDRGIKCDYFCYPKGDFNEDVKQIVEDVGFKAACSVNPGCNIPGQDISELKRTEISGFDSTFDFRKKLSGAYDLLHKLVQAKGRKAPIKSERTNVLYLIWSLGLGGAEKVVINLAKGLDKKRFKPIICCFNRKGAFAQELEKEGIEVVTVSKRGKFDVFVIKRLLEVIKKYNIHILHAHLWGANFWGSIAGRIAGIKVITTIHSPVFADNALEYLLERFVAQIPDRIIAVGGEIKREYIKHTNTGNNKIAIVYNGIITNFKNTDKTQKDHLRDEFNIKDDEKVISMIGRLVPKKGHDYLFEALSQLDGIFKAKLLIVGDGPLRQKLQSIVHSLGLENKVVFTGLRHDVYNILDITDIVVLPSLYEGIPIVLLEAMSKMKPVIATDVGGNRELLDSSGLLVKPAGSKELAEALKKLISNPNLCSVLAESGHNRIKNNFSMAQMLLNTQDIYDQLRKV